MNIVKYILHQVAVAASVTPEAIIGESRRKPVVFARQVAAWLLYRHTRLSTTGIASHLNRAPSTIVHHVRRVRELLQRDREGEPLTTAETELVTLAETCERRCRGLPLRWAGGAAEAAGLVAVPVTALLFLLSRQHPCDATGGERPQVDLVSMRLAVLRAFQAPAEAIEPGAAHGSRVRWVGVRSAFIWLVREYLAGGDARRTAELCGISDRAVRDATSRVRAALNNDVFADRLALARRMLGSQIGEEKQPCHA